MKYVRLGDLLAKSDGSTPVQLEEALRLQQGSGGRCHKRKLE